MSAGLSDTPPGEGSSAPRRRRDRPMTVPLSEFGKEAPPPPRQRLTPRQIVVGTLVTLVVFAVLWVGVVQAGAAANSYWDKAGCVDVRKC
jgi:hypothetical protein